MCVIAYKPAESVITRKTLKKCYAANDDGAGFAFSAFNRLYISKGFFSFRKFYRAYRKIERKYPESNMLIHFRLATSGGIRESTCHPFYVDNNLCVAHNGIFPGLGSEIESDTQEFNRTILQKLPKDFLNDEKIKDALEKYCIENGSKLAFMDNTGKVTLIREKAGSWKDGVWFSNTNWAWENVIYRYTEGLHTSSKKSLSDSSTLRVCQVCKNVHPLSHMDWDFSLQGWVCYECMPYDSYTSTDMQECVLCGGLIKNPIDTYVDYCDECKEEIKGKTIICPYCGMTTYLMENGRCRTCNSLIKSEDLLFPDKI